MKLSLSLVSLLAVSACAAHYAYVPTTNAVATIRGNPAADYPLPPSAPQGDLRIASYGMTDVSPRNESNEVYRALHLRVVLANNGETPWLFDTREQHVQLDGQAALPVTFASANGGSAPPVITVNHDAKRVVDLFFFLPPNLQHEDAIPEFDALWSVHSGSAVFSERTPFQRLTIEPDYGDYDDWDYGVNYYWGGPYWMNPDYPFGAYGRGYGYFGPGVWIHRSPHFWGGYRGANGGHGVGGIHGGGFHGGGEGHGGGMGGAGHR
jgi:hypothetical protein